VLLVVHNSIMTIAGSGQQPYCGTVKCNIVPPVSSIIGRYCSILILIPGTLFYSQTTCSMTTTSRTYIYIIKPKLFQMMNQKNIISILNVPITLSQHLIHLQFSYFINQFIFVPILTVYWYVFNGN